MSGRYGNIEATGLDCIFETSHIEGEAFLVPISMLVVDQRGEDAHVRCDGEGTQDTPRIPACGNNRQPLRQNPELIKNTKGPR